MQRHKFDIHKFNRDRELGLAPIVEVDCTKQYGELYKLIIPIGKNLLILSPKNVLKNAQYLRRSKISCCDYTPIMIKGRGYVSTKQRIDGYTLNGRVVNIERSLGHASKTTNYIQLTATTYEELVDMVDKFSDDYIIEK